MNKRSLADWLFFGCLLFTGGAIARMATGTIGFMVLAGIIVSIIATDNSEAEISPDSLVMSDPSVED